MSSDYQEYYQCEYCGHEYAEYSASDYSNNWYCSICDANEYEANDGLLDELSNEKEIKSWLVSEHGRRYTPTGNKLIKAKALAQLINDICDLSADPDIICDLESVFDYLKFKYKLAKTLETDNSFLENCKIIIIKLLGQED